MQASVIGREWPLVSATVNLHTLPHLSILTPLKTVLLSSARCSSPVQTGVELGKIDARKGHRGCLVTRTYEERKSKMTCSTEAHRDLKVVWVR